MTPSTDRMQPPREFGNAEHAGIEWAFIWRTFVVSCHVVPPVVPTAVSHASKLCVSGDARDAWDATGRIFTRAASAGGRAVAGSNPVAPTCGRPLRKRASAVSEAACLALECRVVPPVVPRLALTRFEPRSFHSGKPRSAGASTSQGHPGRTRLGSRWLYNLKSPRSRRPSVCHAVDESEIVGSA